ncbi:AfsR/SARP family transcriptional regulator [Streptomyces sp. SD15]
MFTDAGCPIGLGGPRQRIVLATLLSDANRIVTVDRLIDAAWWEEPPPSAAVNIRGYIAALRRILHSSGEAKDRLTTHTRGYLLHVGTGELDLSIFMDHLRQGDEEMAHGSTERAAGHFLAALETWQGSPLEGLSVGTSFQSDLERIKELRLLAVERYAQARLSLGQADALVPELRTLTEQYPFRERFCELLIIALHRMGRQAEALATYARVRKMLAEELGIDPTDRLKRLEEQILRGDSHLNLAEAECAPPLAGSRHRFDARVKAPAIRMF